MQAIRVHQFGDADALRYDEVPTPEPDAGEVRIKLAAAGLNFIDIYHRTGAYSMSTPFIPGLEGAGEVDSVGANVTDFKPGDKVAYATGPGSYAEYVTLPADRVVPVPDGIDLQTAAATMLQGMTAHYLAVSAYPIQPGDTALVHAAAGGMGQLLTQIIKLRGGWVVGTVSTEEKEKLARAAGADEIIRYTEQDFETEVKRLTDGQGLHVVYESVGKDTFDKSLNCLRPRGYMVLYGQASGAVPPIDPQILNQKGSLFLTRPTLGAYVATREELLQRAHDLFDWIQGGKLNIRIDETFALKDAQEAHRYMEARKTKGKVLLIP